MKRASRGGEPARHFVQERRWPERPGAVVGRRTARLEVDQRADTTAYGGLELAHRLAVALGLPEAIDEHVQVLKLHMPYHESDHLLVQAYSLFVGGSRLQDLQNLQDSEAVKRMLGAVRLPDPTTAGDFLRRFKKRPMRALQTVLDEVRVRAWSCLAKGKRRQATIDMDSTIKPVYGECKQGADFTYRRCHQENAIEQLKNGLQGLRMPTGELLANGVYMLAAQIAWNLRAWLSLLVLPEQTLRWEWKWFRHAFVYVAARVVEHAGRVVVRLSRSHRWLAEMMAAHDRLRRLAAAW